jgi:hypothetical protein
VFPVRVSYHPLVPRKVTLIAICVGGIQQKRGAFHPAPLQNQGASCFWKRDVPSRRIIAYLSLPILPIRYRSMLLQGSMVQLISKTIPH